MSESIGLGVPVIRSLCGSGFIAREAGWVSEACRHLRAVRVEPQVAGPLAGELAQLERLEQRVLVFYCNTLIRELNLTVEQKGKDGGPAALENAARFPLSLPTAAAVGQP